MDGTAPLELHQLLRASQLTEREAAWEQLIGRHTRLLMAVARSFGGDQDDAMERYSYVLGKLRESDFRRLRAYDPNVGASFPTWLTVTARNLCLDYHRTRFGRHRAEQSSDQSTALRAARRALSQLSESPVTPDSIPDTWSNSAESILIQADLDVCLQSELARLTPTDRLLLTLRFEDDLPASRIAAIIGVPTPFHVYRRLNSLLHGLRLALESRGIDSSQG